MMSSEFVISTGLRREFGSFFDIMLSMKRNCGEHKTKVKTDYSMGLMFSLRLSPSFLLPLLEYGTLFLLSETLASE